MRPILISLIISLLKMSYVLKNITIDGKSKFYRYKSHLL